MNFSLIVTLISFNRFLDFYVHDLIINRIKDVFYINYK